jgi:hypothetical protein
MTLNYHPCTGEVFPTDGPERIDALASALDALDSEIAQLRAYRSEIAAELARHANADPRRTAHLLGGAYSVRVERPAPSYDQAVLRQLAEGPGAEWVRVERYAVRAREWKQAELAAIADPALAAARDALRAAERPGGAPRVSVRKKEETR